MSPIIKRAVVRMPIARAIIESTSPAVAIVRYETERRPKADMTMPTIGINRPKKGYHELIIAIMPSTRPAMAKPIPLSSDVAGTVYAE